MAVRRRDAVANRRLRQAFRRASLGGTLKLVVTRQGDLRAAEDDRTESPVSPPPAPPESDEVQPPVNPSDPVIAANRARIAELHTQPYESQYLSDILHGPDRWALVLLVACWAIGVALVVVLPPLAFAAVSSGVLAVFFVILLGGVIEGVTDRRRTRHESVGLAARPRIRSRLDGRRNR
jgi:hypothetical protein